MISQIPIPDKFEDLSHEQIMEFAKIGFDLYCNFKKTLSNNSQINSTIQKISKEQQEFMKILNSNNQRVIDDGLFN